MDVDARVYARVVLFEMDSRIKKTLALHDTRFHT